MRGPKDLDRVLAGFERLKKTCFITISGGEPFFYEKFVELCSALTAKHTISVNTNLSSRDVVRFADEIDPRRVLYLNCSLNIDERERLKLVDDYIEKFHYLRDKGFFLLATYVLYPTRMHKLREDYAFFKSKGIILSPKVFRGTFCRFQIPEFPGSWRLKRRLEKIYPQGYSEAEKRDILDLITQSQRDGREAGGDDFDQERSFNLSLDRESLKGEPSFRGQFCESGKKFLRMDHRGDLYRCHGGNHYLGNLYEGNFNLLENTIRCPFRACLCPYQGYRYVVNDSKTTNQEKVIE